MSSPLHSTLPVAAPEDPDAIERGSRFARYEVRDRLGAGGMGEVFRAWDPRLRREVALKVLKTRASLGSSGADVHARLLREGRAMAQLAHPNVIPVFDVGIENERAFIAMEVVEGTTLRTWMKSKRQWREVVDVFIAAAEGLAAAHRSGLIHRDFKPSNVLVGHDGRVRVTDFGLARIMGIVSQPRLADSHGSSGRGSSVLTETGAVVGTPAYMAPEQKDGEAPQPSSDQYSFCVALFEALCGQRPAAGVPVRMAAHARIPAALARLIRRGLSPDPAQRYPSMDVVVTALRRIQRGGAWRQWVVLGAAASVVAMVAVPSLQAGAGARCSDMSSQLDGVWDDPRREEVRQAMLGTGVAFASEAHDRASSVLDTYGAAWVDARIVACRSALAVSSEAKDRRVTCLNARRRSMQAVVDVLSGGEPAAIARAPEAVMTLPPIAGCDSPDVSSAEPRPEIAQAATEVRTGLVQADALRRAGLTDAAIAVIDPLEARVSALDDPALTAGWYFARGNIDEATGDYESARRRMDQAYHLAATAGDEPLALRAATHLITVAGARLERFDEAVKWHRHAQALLGRVGTPARAAAVRLSLGDMLSSKGEYDLAVETLRDARQEFEAVYGPDDPRVSRAYESLGSAYRLRGDYEGALEAYERALKIAEDAFGPGHPRVAIVLNSVGTALQRLGRYAEAQTFQQRALERLEQTRGPDHPDVGGAVANVAEIMLHRGAFDDAYENFERAHRIWLATYGDDHPKVGMMVLKLGAVRHKQNRLEPALELYERALAIWERAYGPDHQNIAVVVNNLGLIFEQMERYDDALAAHRRSLKIRRATQGETHPKVGFALANIGQTLRRQGDHAAALAAYTEALEIFEPKLGRVHPFVAFTLEGMAQAHLDAGEPSEAVLLARRAVQARESDEGDPVDLASARFVLAKSLWPDRSSRPEATVLARQAFEAFDVAGEPAVNRRGDAEDWLRERGLAVR